MKGITILCRLNDHAGCPSILHLTGLGTPSPRLMSVVCCKHRNWLNSVCKISLQNRRATSFLDLQNSDSGPFFLMLSTPACHGPFTPAPKYKNNFPNQTAPRDGSYNKHGYVWRLDLDETKHSSVLGFIADCLLKCVGLLKSIEGEAKPHLLWILV